MCVWVMKWNNCTCARNPDIICTSDPAVKEFPANCPLPTAKSEEQPSNGSVAGEQGSTNNGLMQLLLESRNYIDKSVFNRSEKGEELLQKLNVVLAQQH